MLTASAAITGYSFEPMLFLQAWGQHDNRDDVQRNFCSTTTTTTTILLFAMTTSERTETIPDTRVGHRQSSGGNSNDS